MNTPPAVDLRPLPLLRVSSTRTAWLQAADSALGALEHPSSGGRVERLALVALGLGAVVALGAAYISSGDHPARVPDWVFRAWHFGAPVVLAAAATLGLAPGCSRLVRSLTILTIVAYALPAALERWGLPGFDGVPLKLTYGIVVLAALGARLATSLLRGRYQSAV